MIGLTSYHTEKHICRAVLEAIAWQVRDVLVAMEKDSKSALQTLNVDGGASNSNLLMQIQCDICKVLVRRPKCIETTAMGAAAGAIHLIEGIDIADLKARCELDREFQPSDIADLDKRQDMWMDAVKRT